MAECSPRADTPIDYDILHSDIYFEGLLNDAPAQVLFFNDCPESEVDTQMDEIKAQIAANNLPSIGHFTLVIDKRYNDFIPSFAHTWYFSKWWAPIAGPGLPEHEHDVEHIIGYERQFRSILFASVVARGAQNALALGFVDDFSEAMDTFGNYSLDIIEGLADWREYADARICLGGLTDFCRFDDKDLHNKVYNQLCIEFGVTES